MSWSNSQIRTAARASLKGRWKQAVMLTFVFSFVCWGINWPFSIISESCATHMTEFTNTLDAGLSVDWSDFWMNWLLMICAMVGSLVLRMPIIWSFAVSFLRNSRGAEDPFDIKGLCGGYKVFVRISFTGLLALLYIWLWSLLLVVPGIIKALSYAMTPYVLADNPDLKNNKAIERSMAMMEGHKMDLFMMNLAFVGWVFLCIFTLGIGFLWLAPYMNASYAKFYEEVKAEYEQYSAHIKD